MPELPEEVDVRLHQNFPNPFVGRTTFLFSLKEASTVSFAVYDMLGRRVADILSDEWTSAGEQRITFDASGLAAGQYFYRLEAGDTIVTRPMTVVR